MDDDGYSLKCSDRKTRWDVKVSRCVPCDVKPGKCLEPRDGNPVRCADTSVLVVAGQETSTNCGYDDDGGRHESSLRPCRSNTFNDGSSVTCQPCRVCPPGSDPLGPCNATSDTQCRIFRWIALSDRCDSLLNLKPGEAAWKKHQKQIYLDAFCELEIQVLLKIAPIYTAPLGFCLFHEIIVFSFFLSVTKKLQELSLR